MKNDKITTNGNIIYIPHGGGPIPIFGGFGHDKLISFLEKQ